MRAALFSGPRSVEIGERPDPVIEAPSDAVVRVVLGCVSGSDLWYYRGESPHAVGSIGHEFIGRVDAVGPGGAAPRVGERVAVDPVISCGRCYACSVGRGNVYQMPAAGFAIIWPVAAVAALSWAAASALEARAKTFGSSGAM